MKLRKLLSVLLATMLLLTALPLGAMSVHAAGDAAFIYLDSDQTEVSRGENLTVSLNFGENPGLAAWSLWIHYEENVLDFQNLTAGKIFDNLASPKFSYHASESQVGMTWTNFVAGNDCYDTGLVLTLTFTVLQDARLGALPITVGYSHNDPDNLCNSDWDTVPAQFSGITVNVVDHVHVYDNDCDATCNECGETRTITHAYDSVIVNPTCNKTGLITNTCSVCGAIAEEVIPATGNHTYVNPANPICSYCGTACSFTEPTVYAVVDKATAILGGTFTLSVMMENNPGLASWLVEFAYDEDVLELTSLDSFDGVFSPVTFGPLQSPANGLWYDFLTGDSTTNGLLYTATFTVKEDAPLGASAITLFCSDAENMCNFDFEQVEFDFVSTEIVVSEHIHTYDNDCDTDCNECGEIRAITHAYTTETVEPTCSETGLITYTCAVCGAIDTEVLPATGNHRYVNPANPVCVFCGVACVITGPTVYGVVDNYAVARGYTFTLSVVMANNPGLVGWLIDVDYDDSLLELISQTKGDAFTTGSLTFSPMKSPSNALWYDFLGDDCTNNGTLFTFTFRVKEDAAFGSSPITLYCSDYDNMCNADYEKVDFTFVSTTVDIVNHIHSYDADCATACNVCGATREPLAEHTYTHIYDATCDICGAVREVEYLPGDINYDGKVNIRDLGLLQQYLNNWDVDVDPFFCDLNADGKVNIRDLGLLQQFLNNWDVELKLAL